MVEIRKECVWRTVLADDFCIRERKMKGIYEHRFVDMFEKFKNSSLLNSQIVRLQIPALTANTVPHTHP